MLQNYRMLEDRDTNMVYLSHWLREEHPEFFLELTELLDRLEITWELLPHSNDFWCRDFMPVQLAEDKFMKYWYHPSYLLDCSKDKATITNSLKTCKMMGIKLKVSPIIIDGGNIIPCGEKIIMTTKVFSENGVKDYDKAFIRRLECFLEHEVIFIPWHQEPSATLENGGDVYGHADGMIKYCGGNNILMSYDDTPDAKVTEEILLSHGYNITKIDINSLPRKKGCNIPLGMFFYINFLQVGNKIIMPKFNLPSDDVAKDIIQHVLPAGEIHQILMNEIIKEGGALHCLTWNIKK